jgi:hypothetical protein
MGKDARIKRGRKAMRQMWEGHESEKEKDVPEFKKRQAAARAHRAVRKTWPGWARIGAR